MIQAALRLRFMLRFLAKALFPCASRLEAITTSPVYASLLSTVAGLGTVRAFGAQAHVHAEFLDKLRINSIWAFGVARYWTRITTMHAQNACTVKASGPKRVRVNASCGSDMHCQWALPYWRIGMSTEMPPTLVAALTWNTDMPSVGCIEPGQECTCNKIPVACGVYACRCSLWLQVRVDMVAALLVMATGLLSMVLIK